MYLRAYLSVGVFAVISVSLFIASLPMPALLLKDQKPVTGLDLLVVGYWGLIVIQPAWFANPLYFVAFVAAAFRKWNNAIVMLLIALGLGATSYFVGTWSGNGWNQVVLGLGGAFYFWMASFAVLLAGMLLAKRFG